LQRQKQNYQCDSNEHGLSINKSHSCFEFDSQGEKGKQQMFPNHDFDD
jgi:hypothetical protein